MTTQPRVVDPNAAVRDLEPMLRRLVGEDIAFELRLDPSVTKVRIDPTQLEQVIVNLAVNARDALPGGGTVVIRSDTVERAEEAGGGLGPGRFTRIRFSDNGVGIPRDVLDHIFEPFFTTKDPGRGTGLGLAMVYGIVRQHRGSIEVRSEEGAGTEFEILFPEAEGDERPLPEPASAAVGGREHILLVEDDPALLVLGREILSELGYHVETARSGEEALAALESRIVGLDLLVTYVVMPGMGGRDLARAAVARHTGLKVLYVSGYAGDFRPRVDAATPLSALLEKPYTPLSLARKVREVLESAAPSTEGAPHPDLSLPR